MRSASTLEEMETLCARNAYWGLKGVPDAPIEDDPLQEEDPMHEFFRGNYMSSFVREIWNTSLLHLQ